MGTANELLPLLYEELRQLAHARLSAGGRNVTLDTTALVHESFLRLQKAGHLGLEDRDHFLAYAASTMRSIVVDSIRRRRSKRRGGDAVHVTLGTHAASELGASEEEILEVHDALGLLARGTRASPKWWRCATSSGSRTVKSARRSGRQTAPSGATGSGRDCSSRV